MRRLTYIFILLLAVLPLIATEPMDTIQLASLMENRQYEDVVRLTTNELKHFPRSGAMYYYRGMARAYLNNLPEALEDIHQAIHYPKEAPISLPELHVLRGGMYILLQDTTAALNDYTLAIKRAGKHPRNARYYKRRADAYAYFERYEEAVADYRSACELEPENASLQLELARYLAMSNHDAEARQLLEDLCALHPEQTEAPRLLAVLLCYVDEDYNGAVDWTITALTRRYLIDRSLGDAEILFLASAIDYAYVYRAVSKEIERYDAAEQYGLRDIFYLLRAELLRQRGYAEDALADLDSVSIYSIPRELELTLEQEKIQCLVQMQEWQEVIDRSTKQIEAATDPSAAIPFYKTRIAGYGALERYALAEQDLKYLHSTDSAMVYEWLLGSLSYDWRHYTDAVHWFTLALNQEAQDEDYIRRGLLLRGESYLHLKDTSSAYRDFETVLAIDTTYRNTVRHYALYRMGRTEEAIRWAEQLIREYPEADNYYHAACLYAQERDTTKALQYLETALRWGMDSPRKLLSDTDLDNLRNVPEFQALVERYVPALKPQKAPAAKAKQTTTKSKQGKNKKK